METQSRTNGLSGNEVAENTVFAVLVAISFSHMLNDTIQSLIPAIYPILKKSFQLSFTQVGLITLTFQLTASLLQPFVGLYTDHRPKPYSLAIGMGLTLFGLLLLSISSNFPMILCSAGLVGMGSSIFHPEASRLARMASGGRHGFAQSIFQVGGNAGTSLGPLLAALIIVPRGQSSIGWFSLVALVAIILLANVGGWYRRNLFRIHSGTHAKDQEGRAVISSRKVVLALAVLIALIFSKFFYLSCMTSYFTFYLIGKFHLSVQSAQMHLFLFLFSVAAGTIVGGHLGDRFRPQICNLGLYSRRGTLYSAVTLCRSILDRCPDRFYRSDSCICFFCDTGVRPGVGSWESGNDCRPLFWFCLWNGRHRVSGVGLARRSD